MHSISSLDLVIYELWLIEIVFFCLYPCLYTELWPLVMPLASGHVPVFLINRFVMF